MLTVYSRKFCKPGCITLHVWGVLLVFFVFTFAFLSFQEPQITLQIGIIKGIKLCGLYDENTYDIFFIYIQQ